MTLTSGGQAHATLRVLQYQVYEPAECRAVPVRGVRIYPPGQTASVFVPGSEDHHGHRDVDGRAQRARADLTQQRQGRACCNPATPLLTVDAVRPGSPTE